MFFIEPHFGARLMKWLLLILCVHAFISLAIACQQDANFRTSSGHNFLSSKPDRLKLNNFIYPFNFLYTLGGITRQRPHVDSDGDMQREQMVDIWKCS